LIGNYSGTKKGQYGSALQTAGFCNGEHTLDNGSSLSDAIGANIADKRYVDRVSTSSACKAGCDPADWNSRTGPDPADGVW
jgi:hypothetical protein